MDAIVAIVLVALLLLVVYGPLRGALTDWARQTVFEHRNAVFDMACAGKLNFESDEYRTIRRSMNSLIRYAHDITLMKFIYVIFVQKLLSRKGSGAVGNAIRSIPDVDVRREVKNHVDRATMAILRMMFLKSPMATVVIAISMLIVLIGLVFLRLVRVGIIGSSRGVVSERVSQMILLDAAEADVGSGSSYSFQM